MDLLGQDGEVLGQVLTEPGNTQQSAWSCTHCSDHLRLSKGYLAISALCVDQFWYGSTSFWSSSSSVSRETDLDRVPGVRWPRGAWVEVDGWEERLALGVAAVVSYSSSEDEEKSEPFTLRREPEDTRRR